MAGFWHGAPHTVILGAGASLAAFPDGDKNGRKLPLMNNFVETLGLERLFEEHNISHENRNFEEICDAVFGQSDGENVIRELSDIIQDYFSRFRIPDEVTLYDELILSLRKKDAIFSFNWDPLFVQAYQRNVRLAELPSIHFLHGNVAIATCIQDRVVGYRGNSCSVCGNTLEPTELLYPISSKDYSRNPFIDAEWKTLSDYLKNSFILTVFGYSAPKTDADAKRAMHQAWDTNERSNLNETEIVDIRERDELEGTWRDFIAQEHYSMHESISTTLLSIYPRRSCDAWGSTIMMNDPWWDKPIPEYGNLSELQDWFLPLIEEEKRLAGGEEPLSKFEQRSSVK